MVWRDMEPMDRTSKDLSPSLEVLGKKWLNYIVNWIFRQTIAVYFII